MVVQSEIKVKDNGENGVGASKRRSTTEVDHWAFLEEFEAPMWADLSLESTLTTEDNDDAWFYTSHPFHHHSARHLRSAFAHPDVGNDLFNVNLQGACSPHLPSSVSKSRGKDFKSRDWRSNFHRISSNKGHPINDLGGSISISNTVLSQGFKTYVSHENQSEASSSITIVDKTDRGVALISQVASTSGVATSTSSVCGLQDSVVSGEPKEAFGHTGGLLNSLRTNLRKSRATRPALRVGISIDREAKDQKFSAGKSSVGSSSTGNSVGSSAIGNGTKGERSAVVSKVHCCKQESKGRKSSTGKSSVDSSSTAYSTKGRKSSSGKFNVSSSSSVYDTKAKGLAFTSKADHRRQVKVEMNFNVGSKGQNTSFGRPNLGFSNPKFEAKKLATDFTLSKDRNPYVGDLRKRVNPVNGRVKAKKVSEASICARSGYSSKIDGRDYALSAASNSQEAAKSKVILQTTRKVPLNRSRIAQGIRDKLGGSQINDSACSGKENRRERAALSCISGDTDNAPVVKVSDHKAPKLKSKGKVGITSIGSKVRMGRMNDSVMSVDTRVYLR